MGRGPSSRCARNHKCTVTKGGRARKLKGHIKNLEKVRAAARVQTPAEGHEPETTVPHTFANTATMSLLISTILSHDTPVPGTSKGSSSKKRWISPSQAN